MNLEQEFTKMFRSGRINTANAYSLTNNFSPTMRSSMHYHNIHAKEIRQDDKVRALLIRTENIRTVMGRNLNMILERGEKFNTLLSKSEALNKDAQVFKKKSKHAKQMLQRKYYFCYAICAFVFAVFLYMTVVSTCGIRLEYCRSTSHSGGSNNSNNYNSNGENGSNSNESDGGAGN
jgi:vesicle-associated membrane protein 7